jgi:hypothetical protein
LDLTVVLNWKNASVSVDYSEPSGFDEPLSDAHRNESAGVRYRELPFIGELVDGFPSVWDDILAAFERVAERCQKLGRTHFVSPCGHWWT